MINAKLFKLVERFIVNVQHLRILDNALKKQEIIDELKVVKQRIQENYALNYVIEVNVQRKVK